MTERSVKVSLILQATGYMTGMRQVQQETAKTGSEIDKLNQKRQAFSQIGAAGMAMGAAMGVGGGVAISKFTEFDQQMSYVRARTHETAANMDLLRDAAMDAGARTVFSATEAAAAIEELAAAGVSTADILSGGLDAALDLAAAGGMGVADAAGIAATQLQVFKLRGEDMSHVADLLAAGAGKAMGEVSDLGAALAQGGQVAQQTGLSIEETTAALSAFAAQGLLGSDAGTSFKSMLQRLTPQSTEARDKMRELGISAYDANGQFVGLAEFAGNLEEALRDLTPEQRNSALATIFGSDAVRAANVLYSEGEKGIRDWTDAVNDQGYAAETAAMRLDNLAGDIEALGGAMDTAFIQSGSGANEALRDLVQIATGAVDVFNALPQPLQQAGLYLGIAAAGVGLLGGAALVAVPRIAEFKAVTEAAGFSMKGISVAAGAATLGITAVIGVVASLASAQAEAQARAEAYADTLEDGTNRVTKATRDMVVQNLSAKRSASLLGISLGELTSIYDKVETLQSQGVRVSLDLVTDAALGQADALAELKGALDAGRAAFHGSQDEWEAFENITRTVTDAVVGENGSIEEAIRVARQQQAATKDGVSVTEEATSAYVGAASAVTNLTDAISELTGAIDEANGKGQDAVSANIQYQDTLADVQEQIDKARAGVDGFGLGLDMSTDAGRRNIEILNQMVQDSQDAAQAQFDLTGNTDEYRASLEAGRQALIDRAIDLGANAEQAAALADQIYRIPSATEWEAIVRTEAANAGLQGFYDRWNNKQITLSVQQSLSYAMNSGSVGGIPSQSWRNNAKGNYYEMGKPKHFAAGGFASGMYEGVAGGIQHGPGRVFAERDMGVPWESYISGRPQDRERNIGLWEHTGDRLGAWERFIGPGSSTTSVDNSIVNNNNLSMPLIAEPRIPPHVQAMKVVRRVESRLNRR